MRFPTPANTTGRLAIAAVAVVALLAGCGGSSKSQAPAPSGVLTHVGGTPRVILSPVGAQQIGLQLTPVRGARGTAVVPYAALVYDPTGVTYAFTRVAPLTYAEVRVNVARIAGNAVFVTSGLQPGSEVVTVGAEELYGVASGVLAQT